MNSTKPRKRHHLRLVETIEPPALPPILTDPAAKREYLRLTERLVEISIEIADLTDGDPDIEANGDEFEDSDPAEDDNAL